MVSLIQTNNWKSRNFLIIMLVLQFIMYGIVFLNIPIARQVIGFLYLTFIPGIILLRILKLGKLDMAEIILFSVGLSIAFLMLTGLLINELCPLIGVSKPLSQVPLMVILNSLMLLLCFLSYLKDKDFSFSVAENIKLHPLTILLFCLPLLSVIGVLLVNTSPSANLVLILMIIVISGLVVLITFSKKLVSPKLYPLALLMIAIALLFHTSLISNHINGFDIQYEFYIFKLTKNNSHWNPIISTYIPEYTRINAMLSVTVLPSIYSSMLNLEGTWIFKVIYPLIFSFVPLGLYKLYQPRFGRKVAFLSTFFFIAHETFFTEILGNTRQIVAELFYVLLFLVLLNNKKMNSLSKSICFIFFSFALVVSHYAISYIFMFIIFFAWLSLFLLKNKSKSIIASFVALFFTILFSWYIYVSASGPFNAIVNVGNNVYRSIFTQFFNPASRGETVLIGLGMESPQSFGHLISRIFAYATEFFIVIGFIKLMIPIIKRKKILCNEYIVIASINMALLGMCIVLPYFARSLNMTRFYHLQLFFLAPLCILGGKTIFGFISNFKTESYVLGLVLIVLVPFFLFQTSLVYEVTGDDSWSIPLSKYRMGLRPYTRLAFVDEQDVFGAEWLSENIDVERNVPIYSDGPARWHLLGGGYGMIDMDRIEELSNTTTVLNNGIVYLTRTNTFYGITWMGEIQWEITEFSSIFNNMNTIYSNGGCVIYKNL